ncbi:putative nitroreductase HBN1 [Metarhizium anisopliae]
MGSVANVSADQWLAAASHRRSVYPLKGTSSVSDARVKEIIEKVLSFAPSSYNTQPVRITLITGPKHKQFWDTIIAAAEPVLKGISEDVWNAMSPKFQLFKSAYGSILFWESGNTIKESGETHKSAAHMFAEFGDHANGMHQILVWTALSLEGLGANLQHLNAIPPVEAAIKKFAGVPEDYKLKAHLNYGDEATEHPAAPGKLAFSETLKVIS